MSVKEKMGILLSIAVHCVYVCVSRQRERDVIMETVYPSK